MRQTCDGLVSLRFSLRDLALVLLCSGVSAVAETVTVNPPAGSETNAQTLVTGGDTLAVNTGATGGTVRLNPYNDHTGGTTLGSGTLVVSKPAKLGGPHELGAGPFTQTGGTLRYAGPTGGAWTAAVTLQPAVDTAAVVWQIDNDLVMAGDVQQPTGCFIKDGKGTLTFTKPFTLGGCTTSFGNGIYGGYTDFSPDRAPTKGYAPFTISDGTVVIDTPYDATVTNVLSGVDVNLAIGQGRTADGEETTGELILSNGITRAEGRINIGSTDGRQSNSSTRLRPTLRVLNGARLLVGPTGNKNLYMGVMWSDNTLQWNAPLLEVAGAGSSVYCNALSASYHKGANCTVLIRDGGYLHSNANPVFSSNSGSADTVNEVVVTGAGSRFYAPGVNNNKTAVLNMSVTDGGTLLSHRFINDGKGKVNVVFDGGTWHHLCYDNVYPMLPSTLTSVKVGPGGMTVALENGKNSSDSYSLFFEKGIDPLDDSGTDGGVRITQGARRQPVHFNAANTYCGPTVISQTSVWLGKSGKLPSGTALSISSNYGGLLITNGIQQTVGSLSLGSDDEADSPILGFDPASSLYVTGELRVGGKISRPPIRLYSAKGVTTALSASGTYTFLSAREEDFDALSRLAACAAFPLKPDGTRYVCSVERSGGRALLKVAVSTLDPSAQLVLDNTDTNATLSATAEQIAAAQSILTNPGDTADVHGPVELGALAGFASGGRLIVGSGTTYASNLSFAADVSDITLKFGTLAYTGGDAAIPGLTVNASSSRSAVLNITNENTTLTIADLNTVVGTFTKTGPGTLKLKPPEGTRLVFSSNAANNGNGNGVTALGDGPSTGTRAFNIVNGWTEIGTVGDPTDAPDIFAPADFSVGSQSHRNGIAEQTAGNLRMNNGTLNISTVLYIGYYCGNYASNPDLNLTPTLEQNGGFITCNAMQIGQSASSASGNRQTDSPRYFHRGGTNVVRNAIYAAHTAVSEANTWRTTIDVTDGLLVVSNNFICGNNASAMAVDVAVTDNGRLEVGGVFYPAYSNTRDTNTFTLAGNGTIRARTISGNNVNRPLVATFDGGTFESFVTASDNGQIVNLQNAYLGAGGLNVDLSHQTDVCGESDRWLVLEQRFDSAPGCEGADGGITLHGVGSAAAQGDFADSTFSGPVRVLDGARFAPLQTASATRAVEFAPGTILHAFDGTTVVKDLTLGSAGASDPVSLELFAAPAGYGFVATNALAILSPVTVTTVADSHDFNPELRCGVYTALVYNASNADVDLSLIRLSDADAATQLVTLSISQTTVADGGEFDGMKAVVVTIAAKNSAGVIHGNAWSSVTSGGSWSTATNWDNADLIPNARGVEAYFKPATKAGVAVSLDTPVTVGTLTLNGGTATYGYTLSGSALTLDGDDSTPAVANASGTNTIAAPIILAKAAQFRTTAGNELRVTGGVAGAGDLNVNTHVKSGAGQVNLKVDPAYAGKVTTGSGRVVVDDLSFVQSADQLTLGRGTFLYTGPDVEIPGFTLNAGSKLNATFESTADVTVNGIDVGTSSFIKLGTGTLRLHGTGTFSPNTQVDYDDDADARVMAANGDGPTKTFRGMNISQGTFVQGEVGDDAHAPTVSTPQIAVGSRTLRGPSTYELNNGLLNVSSTIWLGYYAPNGNNYMLTLRQNGGTLICGGNFQWGYENKKWGNHNGVSSCFEMNGGTATFGGILYMGRNQAHWPASQTCRFVQNGGEVSFGGDAHLAYFKSTAKGYMDLNGGVLSIGGTLYAANTANNESTLRLNAGATLRCNGIASTVSGSTTRFYANGGEFRPLGLAANALEMPADAFTSLYVSTNGLVINTDELFAGGTYTIRQPVLHDPDCGDTDGGLTKRGGGMLKLVVDGTYLGDTAVEGGVLRIPSGSGFLSSKVTLSNSVFEVESGSVTLRELAGCGSIYCDGLTVTNCIAPSPDGCFFTSGDVTLAGGVTLDLSAFEDGTFAVGDMLPLVVCEGTATAPEMLKATPASAMEVAGTGVKTLVQDGTLYAVFSSGGTILMVR